MARLTSTGELQSGSARKHAASSLSSRGDQHPRSLGFVHYFTATQNSYFFTFDEAYKFTAVLFLMNYTWGARFFYLDGRFFIASVATAGDGSLTHGKFNPCSHFNQWHRGWGFGNQSGVRWWHIRNKTPPTGLGGLIETLMWKWTCHHLFDKQNIKVCNVKSYCNS